jgi:hypothetical protein
VVDLKAGTVKLQEKARMHFYVKVQGGSQKKWETQQRDYRSQLEQAPTMKLGQSEPQSITIVMIS